MSKFKAGEPRPANAGRKKGVPNKAPSMRSLRDSLASQSFDLGEQLVALLASTNDAAIKLKILQTIAQYTQVTPRDEGLQDASSNPVDDNLPSSEEELLSLVPKS